MYGALPSTARLCLGGPGGETAARSSACCCQATQQELGILGGHRLLLCQLIRAYGDSTTVCASEGTPLSLMMKSM